MKLKTLFFIIPGLFLAQTCSHAAEGACSKKNPQSCGSVKTLSVPAAQSGKNSGGGVIEYAGETVYYPPGWKYDPNQNAGRGPEVGIDIYHNYVWFDQSRPKGRGDWATIHLVRWNCRDCMHGENAGTLTDFIKDKDCNVAKCAYEQSKCPVHSPGIIPRWRLTNKCDLVTKFPKLVGGVCGTLYAKKKHRNTTYYYFEGETEGDTEGTDVTEPGEHLKEITVIFRKGRFIYTSCLMAPRWEFDKYMRDFEYVIKKLTPKPLK